MTNMIIQSGILKVLETKNYVLLCDLPELTYQNFVYVEKEVDELIESGKLAKLCDGYSEKFKKLFPYITSRIEAKGFLEEKIKKGQYTRQRTTLVRSVMEDYQASCSIHPLREALDLIKEHPGKIKLKYHALPHEDVVKVYETIIQHGAKYEAWSKARLEVMPPNKRVNMMDFFEPLLT